MANDVKVRPVSGTADLLAKWLVEATVSEEAHYAAAKPLVTKQMVFGYPVAILNAAVASSVFGTLSKEIAVGWRVATGILSVLAAVLAAAAAFGRYAERAESHRRAAVKFSAVRLLLEQTLATGRAAEAGELYDDLREQLNAITDTAPPVPEQLWRATHDRIVNAELQRLNVINASIPLDVDARSRQGVTADE